MHVCIFGLGEAGGLFATDLVGLGLKVTAFDPASVATPEGVIRCETPSSAAVEADVILALTAAADAQGALEQALDTLPVGAIYADFSTAAASLKRELAESAFQRGIAFADVALLAVVPGNGLQTNSLVSGSGAVRFARMFQLLGMPVEAISGQAGEAATRKLLRSVFMKGLAGVMIEALEAAEQANLSDWLWENLTSEITKADESLVRRLVTGSKPHARRRLHEMEASSALLQELGVEPLMTRATVENLRRVLTKGLPRLPDATP